MKTKKQQQAMKAIPSLKSEVKRLTHQLEVAKAKLNIAENDAREFPKGEPKVGNKIYVETHLYISHGADDVDGGIATVSHVKEEFHGSSRRLAVSVLEHPGHGYYWDILGPKQAELKKEFGKQKAQARPDYEPEANRWD